MSVLYSTTPFTVTGEEIDPDAPRSQGMSDQAAADVIAIAENLASVSMQISAEVTPSLVGGDVTLTITNVQDGDACHLDWGDGNLEDGLSSPPSTETHTYLNDGVYTIALYVGAEMVQTQAAVNWPPPGP